MELPYFDPYRVKMVEEIAISTAADRKKWLAETQYNLFELHSSQIMVDLLTDSGTGGLSAKQWAAMMTGDESYAGSESFENLKNTVKKLTGYKYLVPAHQGRASENVLFSALIKEGDIVPGNLHFFTTQIHIEKNGGSTIDCTCVEAKNVENDLPFKGNVDLEKLEHVYKTYGRDRIPCCVLTITCNSVGGQPVSMANIQAVSELSKKYGIPVLYDAARFAQNAYFIKTKEEGYKDKSIREIVRKTFDLADGMFMSSKKDGLVNMGGFIALNDESLYKKTSVTAVLYEGFITYGGMSGRTMNALAQGLREVTTFTFLKSRIGQVEYLSEKLTEYGISHQQPVAGHAVFLDALKILPSVPREEFPSHVLAVELYLEGGIRAGNGNVFPVGKDEGGKPKFAQNDLLRLTVPQRLYTRSHLDYVAAVIHNVRKRQDKLTRGYKVSYEPEAKVMKMFGVKFEKLNK